MLSKLKVYIYLYNEDGDICKKKLLFRYYMPNNNERKRKIITTYKSKHKYYFGCMSFKRIIKLYLQRYKLHSGEIILNKYEYINEDPILLKYI